MIVDEIQKLPVLLDYIQMGIERKNIQFLLSGSSARKLKKRGANLLGGRALHFTLHPLTAKELRGHFHLSNVLNLGSLPLICSLPAYGEKKTAIEQLKSYVTTNSGSYRREKTEKLKQDQYSCLVMNCLTIITKPFSPPNLFSLKIQYLIENFI